MKRLTHLYSLALTGVLAASASGVEHAVIDVVENDTGNSATSVTITVPQGSGGITIVGGNRGDYDVAVQNPGDEGFDRSNDISLGTLLTSPLRNASPSSAVDPNGFTTWGVPTSMVSVSAGGYFIPVHRSPDGDEWNSNVATVYFPNSEGWFAGHALNSSNGGVIDSVNGSSAIELGTNLVDILNDSDNPIGQYELTVPGVTDHRRQGLLFVTGGKNEDNYAGSSARFDGSKFLVTVKDNGDNAGGSEADPFAFAFVPVGTPGVVMGRVSGNGKSVLRSGNFNVSPVDGQSPNDNKPEGVYRLEIPGYTPSEGTLLVSPENSQTGGNIDNIVTAEPTSDGLGWHIHSRDIAGGVPPALESVFNQSAFSFAFFPNTGAATAPGAIPTVSSLKWDESLSSTIGANVTVIENNPGNDTGDNEAFVSSGTPGIGVPSVNRGDIGLAMGGDYFRAPDGLMMATVTENRNPDWATNGGAVSPNTSIQGGAWMVHTSMANGNSGFNTEANTSFSTAFFQANAGYQMDSNVPTDGGQLFVFPNSSSETDPTIISGIGDPSDLASEGVLMVNGYGNDDNFASVGIFPNVNAGDGSEVWAITLADNNGNLEGDSLNYVWMPFSDPDLVAGRIGAGGNVLASTEEGGNANFSLTRTDVGTYELLIPGVTPEDGMLLLNGNADFVSNGAMMTYEAGENTLGDDVFVIQALSVAAGDPDASYAIADFEFQFAYVGFGIPDGLPGDFNGDGQVDSIDYAVWRENLGAAEDGSTLSGNGNGGVVDQTDFELWLSSYGSSNTPSPTPAAAAPEPTALAVLILGLSCLAGSRVARKL